MFTHPHLALRLARQRQRDVLADAARERLAARCARELAADLNRRGLGRLGESVPVVGSLLATGISHPRAKPPGMPVSDAETALSPVDDLLKHGTAVHG